MEYKHLLSPVTINNTIVKNRIVAAPVSDEFEEKAIGGAGIVIAGHAIVEYGRSSFASPTEPDIFTKYQAEQTVSRIRQIKQAGAKASIEIFHAGCEARVIDYAKGPIDFTRDDGTVVKAMDLAAMEETLKCYEQCVSGAKELGFDMLFMHFGHGWLPAQFLSPHFNSRTDEFGGTIENRMKFPLEILKRVRKAVGPLFPIDMRISAYEWVDDSIELTDVIAFLKEAQKYVDTVQVSSGLDMNRNANIHMVTTNFSERLQNLKWAKHIKQELNIPVSVVGSVLSPEEAEEIIANGDVDFVAFGRSFIADPNWPRKLYENRREEITPCVRCLYCYHIATNRKNVGCTVNPRYKNEHFVPKEISKTEYPKNVVIIGAGPGGISAALGAEAAGHNVTLLEKEKSIGGLLKVITKEHYKDDIVRYYSHLKHQVESSSVDIRLNFAATPQNIEAFKPDAIIIAIGSKERKLTIPGSNQKNVLTGVEAIQNHEQLGENVAVIGAGTVGSEIALELAEIHMKNVTVIEMGETFTPQGNMLYRLALEEKINNTPNLKFKYHSETIKIEDNKIFYKSTCEGDQVLNVDNVIVSIGMEANDVKPFMGIIPNTIYIGDCDKPRLIKDAVFEGFTNGMNI